MRGLALMLMAGVALGGCEQVCGPVVRPVSPPVQACAKPFERTVSFTSAQQGDKLVVERLRAENDRDLSLQPKPRLDVECIQLQG